MSGIDIHVGGSFDAIAERVTAAWHRAERGESVSENHVTFTSWEALARVMTGDRLALLRELHRASGVAEETLAQRLGRDPNKVRDDVDALLAAGLIERGDVGLRADFDEIRTVLAL